jgi:cytosine/creatinine deaminase
MGLFSVEEICARTKALGLGSKVTISHGFCLGGITERKVVNVAFKGFCRGADGR